MPLLVVILVVLAIGVLVALINKYGADYVDVKFIRLINILAIVGTILWLMKVFGVWDYLMKITT